LAAGYFKCKTKNSLCLIQTGILENIKLRLGLSTNIGIFWGIFRIFPRYLENIKILYLENLGKYRNINSFYWLIVRYSLETRLSFMPETIQLSDFPLKKICIPYH